MNEAQDVDVVQDENTGRWLVISSLNTCVSFPTENEACQFQTYWRTLNGIEV